jgi:hypothetical protein
VEDSGNQHTIKQHLDGNITCNTIWTIQCSRMLKNIVPIPYVGYCLAYGISPGWWMMMSVEQSVEWLARETEVLAESLPPVPLCPSQIPHDLSRVWTRAATVVSQRLTAWAMALPLVVMCISVWPTLRRCPQLRYVASNVGMDEYWIERRNRDTVPTLAWND